ncbi:DUF6907 domain-containing protein [Actinacidiphila glaucinigra]|uniref:DUF6907 domain-containing protein n=1 Tax=Actinacidiphila glaucinigra TaxID=235986 RepID=UPI002E34EA1F|nr:hypothetical protein [Actinacidiphila glaucinigra]
MHTVPPVQAAMKPRTDDQRHSTANEPRRWTFTNRYNDQPVEITCLPGCTTDHSRDMDRPQFPEDIWCQTRGRDVTLPVDETGKPEEYRVLSVQLDLRPFSGTLSERQPTATVEVLDDHWISGLDPDALATVIRTLAGQVDQLREMHGRLIETREQYQRWMA